MYDKLGELLSEKLESGDFFDQNKNTQKINQDSVRDSIKNQTPKQKSVEKSIHTNKPSKACIVKSNNKNNYTNVSKSIKYAQNYIKDYLTFIGVSLDNDTVSYDEVKKLFHKKLMRFHPDRNSDNEVIKKITREKTAQLLEAWEILDKWFKS